ncbi:protein chiffon-like isoform X1 [Pieris brassicae]|uniref:protein chiffon-like isoform X1 n=2 Tax=Pieris brassicae TaxID=7116 RepID=UPI001E661A58|nr:protein chiffon-like isoform X1 [Pieris brassicae]
MVSTALLQEKYNKIRNNFCFYLDIQESAMCRSLSRRLQDMGLHQEVFLTPRVTHVILDHKKSTAASRWPRREGRARVDAMLERLRAHSPPKPVNHNYIELTVQKAINLLDKLYDTFFTQRKAHINYFSKHFIKIEFLDNLYRPVYKEFDEWPQISLEPDPAKEKKKLPENIVEIPTNNNIGSKMTRKSRPRIKEREIKEEKGGYCEMCNVDYADATLHRRSPHHLAFVRDHANFLSLDSLITSGTDVNTFLDKATPVNGERRSLRKLCNGEAEPKNRRSKRSQSPDTVNGNVSPKRNGGLEEEKKRNTRCSKKTSESTQSEDRQYYKVVGVSTKLRSSGGFTKKREVPPCNGTKPLVVKIRKVRRSELSVLSDEAEQFMFPKRASSTSSTSSDEEPVVPAKTRKKTSPQQPPPERQRLARPVALKEESSEEDIWPEDNRKKRRGPPVVKRGRRKYVRQPPSKPPEPQEPDPPPIKIETPLEPEPPPQPEPAVEPEVSPLREEPVERCMKWEDGRLKYTPAVEQLEFAFESVPHSEPWFSTFKRQDQDKVVAKNVPQFFALYSKSPKLPYEIGQLPPLKPNCCPLSDLVKREGKEKPGPSRAYGTRGMKKQRMRKRTAAILAMESHPRKSPREHASTLAILGSAGLLHRSKNVDDAKSTASEDTLSETLSKPEPVLTETQETSERLQQFLSEVFEDESDYDVSEDVMENDISVITSKEIPDFSSLVSECEKCDLISNEIKQDTVKTRERRGKFKKKNRTGWPSKKNKKKSSRNSSIDDKVDSLDRSSVDLETLSEADENKSESEENVKETKIDELELPCPMDIDNRSNDNSVLENDKSIHENKDGLSPNSEKRTSSDSEEKVEIKRKTRALQGLCDWLPVVRVARVDPNATRRLRSAGRVRSSKLR